MTFIIPKLFRTKHFRSDLCSQAYKRLSFTMLFADDNTAPQTPTYKQVMLSVPSKLCSPPKLKRQVGSNLRDSTDAKTTSHTNCEVSSSLFIPINLDDDDSIAPRTCLKRRINHRVQHQSSSENSTITRFGHIANVELPHLLKKTKLSR